MIVLAGNWAEQIGGQEFVFAAVLLGPQWSKIAAKEEFMKN